MNRDEAISALRSQASYERLQAARYFVDNASQVDLSLLKNAKQVESDSYVEKRLTEAIQRVITHSDAQSQGSDAKASDAFDEDLLARSFEWVGGLLMHEMEGPIGRAAFYASKEMPNYAVSKTKKELESVKLIFTGIEQIVKASQPPRPTEFDLAATIEEIVAREVKSALNLSIIGQKPFLLIADPTLLQFAIVNGLKNAVEAIENSGGSKEQHPIVVTWGSTDRDNWISIIDHGPGVSGSITAKFEIGRSTKVGHRGFGLAIAKRAMDSMQGKVTLQPGNDGGAQYEIRWAKTK